MSKGKKKKQGKHSHINKWEKFSQAEGWYQKKIREDAKLTESPSESSRKSLDSKLRDVSLVLESGAWWEYSGFRFLKNIDPDNKGFDREEVLVIQPQLEDKVPLDYEEQRYVLVSGRRSKFYVTIEPDKLVMIPYTETRDSKGKEYKGYIKTSNLKDIPDIRVRLEK